MSDRETKPVWLSVEGHRVGIVEKPPFGDNGLPNAPAAERAVKLKEAFEAKGYEVEGPFSGSTTP